MRVPPAQACTRPVQYSFDRSQTPTADPHGWRAAFSQGGRLASVAVRTPPALAHASPCPRLLLGSSLSTTRMPTNASEPVQEHGDGVRRGRRVRCHLRAQKWHRKWWWRAARASHGPRPATAGLCQSWWTRSCRTLSSRWRKLCPPIGASFRSSRDSVCAMRGFKSRWYLHSSGEHTVAHGR
jgi:hypothetical protein